MKIARRKLTPREAWICFGKALLLVILIPWAGWAVLDEWAEHRLGQALLDLKDEGFATCLEYDVPPEVPPEENAALFYSAAFAAINYIDRGSPSYAEDFVSAEPEDKAQIL